MTGFLDCSGRSTRAVLVARFDEWKIFVLEEVSRNSPAAVAQSTTAADRTYLLFAQTVTRMLQPSPLPPGPQKRGRTNLYRVT
jgi:hypothetical protein